MKVVNQSTTFTLIGLYRQLVGCLADAAYTMGNFRRILIRVVHDRKGALYRGSTKMKSIGEELTVIDKFFSGSSPKEYEIPMIKFTDMNILSYKRLSFTFSTAIRQWLSFVICMVCLALFVISAYDKIVEHERFVKGLSKIAVIGIYAQFIAWAVPLVEVVVAVVLLVPKTQKNGLRAFIAVMAIFTGYIGGMWLWAEKLPCHCNLIVEKLSWGQHVVFNLAFIGLAILALRLAKFKDKS